MTPTTGLVISGVGALTPVGLRAPASFAALRAGVSGLREIEAHHVDGELFDKVPVVGGRVPMEWFNGGPVEWEWPAHERFGVAAPPAPEKLIAGGSARLLQLAPPAAADAWRDAVPNGTPQGKTGLYLGLDYGDDITEIVNALGVSPGVRVDVAGGASAGRAAGLLALEAAAHALMSGEVQIALVGGIDSQLRPEILQRLEEKGSLRSGTNPQGVIPGESSAFIVVERADAALRRGARPLAWIMSCASGKEPTHGTEEPNQAVGLSQTLRVARNEGGFETSPLVVCDLNGDRYRAMEWALARTRSLGDLHGDMDVWHPADCTGDTGAASGVLNVAWAATALKKGYARADRVLVWGASDGRSRAAAVLAPFTS